MCEKEENLEWLDYTAKIYCPLSSFQEYLEIIASWNIISNLQGGLEGEYVPSPGQRTFEAVISKREK